MQWIMPAPCVWASVRKDTIEPARLIWLNEPPSQGFSARWPRPELVRAAFVRA